MQSNKDKIAEYEIVWDVEEKCHVLCHIHKESGWMASCHPYTGEWVCASCGISGVPPEEIQFVAELAGCANVKRWYGLDYGKFERTLENLEK